MENGNHSPIAIVGVGAILPDAPNVATFWQNVKTGRYSISEVTPDRWDSSLYYDPDPSAPDKTYSKIGGWVREYSWDPMKWHLPLPPRVTAAMDEAQRWAIACTRQALDDFGYPKRSLDPDRTAVILGNAMAGEKHYLTSLRVYFPEYARELEKTSSFAALPEKLRGEITRQLHDRMGVRLPEITEDSMPGELANCIAGRIANLYNFHGPNYVVDAACASAMAAMCSAVEGLVENDYDVAITGGIDRNMGAPTFVKFCKIGALSATGTRPYAEGADGFVMGEGAAIFVLKRLADAERDSDAIYAVLRGIAGSSDGRGKGITAPNPIGQKICVERAWQNAGLSPATVTMIEGHGTSTRVGDVVEAQSMADVLSHENLPAKSVALGSVKSNIGHLKGAAGAAGMLKAAMALRDKVLPPSLHCEHPSPDIDFAHSPLYVNTELKPWTIPADSVRRAGVSAFGFGGTNFHVVMEEHIPGKLNGNGKRSVAVAAMPPEVAKDVTMRASSVSDVTPTLASNYKAPLRGALVIGAASEAVLAERLRAVQKSAKAGNAPAPATPAESDLRASERLAIDYADAADLASKSSMALKAFEVNQSVFWKALRGQGIFRGSGPAPKVAFLYTGQGSQYANMLRPLCEAEPIVGETFREADRVMSPLLGKPLTEFIFVDPNNADAVAKAEEDLRQTEITQPAVLAIDTGVTRLLAAYGIQPDMTMGHSMGEYGALVASGAISFEEALEAVSARGRGMARVAVGDKGKMAAVFAPLAEAERILKTITGYVVIANINSTTQSVIGGASSAVEQATEIFLQAGYNVVPLPVSHAFHTSIVAPASEPLRQMLQHLKLQPPRVPVIANLNGEFYPTGSDAVPKMLDLLAQQVACPVQFVKGLRTLYEAGARVFVEVGPKKALQGFAEDVLGGNGDVVSLFTNHPKVGDIAAFNQGLCGLYAAGLGRGKADASIGIPAKPVASTVSPESVKPALVEPTAPDALKPQVTGSNGNSYAELGRVFADAIDRAGWHIYHGKEHAPTFEPVVITGASLGLPGTDHIFDDENIARLLRGEQFIDVIPDRLRREILEKHITRLVKSDNGGPTFESIEDVADVIKLAGRGGDFDLEKEFGVSSERVAALDRVTSLAIGVGIDALRDAGIPLVLRYKTTTKGTQLPDRWALPDEMRDDTGVICASAFPAGDTWAGEMAAFYEDRHRREQLGELKDLRARVTTNGQPDLVHEIDRRIAELQDVIEREPYVFDRRFLFHVLSMGHSQFAEYIGARGPNTQINAACASTTQAVAIAEDWIRAGRCRRVIVISADDITTDNLLGWFGAGFLASGAAATDEVVESAALPFDRRRHGMIIGMGAASLVVESAEAARERGIQPICEVLSTMTANSAFHGTRLDVQHIGQVMEQLLKKAEVGSGIQREQIAPHTVFVSHETYTPARGGSASAEIFALRKVFGDSADQIVIANTKGFTGHAMGAGIEDVLAVKSLETGCVPPVANFKEIDPELGALNLSKGGSYPVEYALRLGAGFGSQISMTLLRWAKPKSGVRPATNALGFHSRITDEGTWKAWLGRVADSTNPDLEVVNRTLRVREPATAVRDAGSTTQAIATPVVRTEVEVQVPKPTREKQVPKAASEVRAVVVETRPPEVKPVTPAKVETPAVAEKPATASDPVKEKILALVTEKTGYPPDMLALDLDLEADLGVDTVKQAEMFAAIREIYNIPRDENRKLRDYPTLAHVIRFVYEKRPDLATPVSASQPAEEQAATATAASSSGVPQPTAAPLQPTATTDPVKDRILELVVEKTGYPKDMLDLDLDLEADLGVDTVKQAEMFAAIREMYSIPRDENRKLRDYPTLAHVIRFVYEKRPDLATAQSTLAPAEKRPEEPVAAPLANEPAIKAAATDSVKDRILELVVEKTGYPKDMLDLDLDLEADLGVDTVKQAEMFAAIREMYSIPRDENRKLRDYPTLAHVIRFVYEKRPDLATAQSTLAPAEKRPEEPVAAPLANEPAIKAAATDSVKDRILELVVEKTGYPKDMLDLDLDLEADLGVDTVKQAEMFAAIREMYSIPRDENRKLRDYPTLAHVIRFVYEKRPDLAVTTTAPTTSVVVETMPLKSEAVSEPINDHAIANTILEIVAEKTGYPKDMLDLDLDLEADLGIDTVKQAEMFAAVRAAYNIPRDETLKLRDFPTLAHVIQFARERSAKVKSPVAASPEPVTNQPAKVSPPQPVRPAPASFDAANRIPRRVPISVLRPPLQICKPTGVQLGAGSRVVVMPDQGGVADELCKKLRAIGVDVLLLDYACESETLASRLKEWMSQGPVQGVYWLPALDNEGPLTGLSLAAWREGLRVRVTSLYAAMRVLYEQMNASSSFLISATRLGGQHGYDSEGAVAPMGGAVVGFTKSFKRERTNALVKAVDFETKLSAEQIADLIIAETLHDPGAIEIGYKNELRWTVGLREQPLLNGHDGLTLDRNTVFLVTGAAGSIVSAITSDLAAASGGVFYLLDVVPKPDPANDNIRRFTSDKEGLKRELAARLKADGKRVTPAMVEKELAALERAQAAQTAIDAVRAAGGTAHYFSVDLTDADAVAAVIRQVRQQYGRIDVLLHAAGMERSHFLPDKDPQEFDLVFGVKANGWFNLLKAIGDMPLAATVAFSSIAGRFGNAGQADYSSANDLLCKITSSFRSRRPQTHGIAIDWTAWRGIGMASRGSIPKMMEAAGIDMLPPEAGIPLIRRELTSGAASGEIVIGDRLGILMNEFDATGGLDPEALEGSRKQVSAQGPMVGMITSMGIYRGLTMETTLDPRSQPFLNDHRIDGTPVLPGVMGIEAFAEAALRVHPAWNIEAIEEVSFLAPFKFYKDEPRTVTIEAQFYPQDEKLVADCRLIGKRMLPGQAEPQETTHFTARVLISKQAPQAANGPVPHLSAKSIVGAAQIYRIYFHGPAYQVLERAWWDGTHVIGEMSTHLPVNHKPSDRPTLMSPRLIELCFQTAGVWEIGTKDQLGLPRHINQVSWLSEPESSETHLYALVTPHPEQGTFDAEVVDPSGKKYVRIDGYRTAALPTGLDAETLEPLHKLVSLEVAA